MNISRKTYKRRTFLKYLAGLNTGLYLWPAGLLAARHTTIKRIIPASREAIPAIGMGSWLTFDIGNNIDALATRIQVLQSFFDNGGGMIDSSPMYGSSEQVIGKCLAHNTNTQGLFSATKVWTPGKDAGTAQMERSLSLWGKKQFDLMQIHNMLDWETHLETLKTWKADGRIKYIGITTSHGRRHTALEQALKTGAFDFVQFTYNVIDREAEKRLLPLAQERGVAVIINRPFRGGDLFGLFSQKPLPAWASEFDCNNWAQFFLKYIISHPAVTCTIPATSQVAHMQENMGALVGRLPDVNMRNRMIRYLQNV
jgi:diketogulonate reductase-like aldo/keto reductase